jgi:hypothetical protein
MTTLNASRIDRYTERYGVDETTGEKLVRYCPGSANGQPAAWIPATRAAELLARDQRCCEKRVEHYGGTLKHWPHIGPCPLD